MLDSFPHFAQAAFEEMVGGFNDDELLGFWQASDERCQSCFRCELVAGSADEQLRLRACFEKGVVVGAVIDRGDRGAETDDGLHTWIGTGGAKADGGSEGEPRKDHRQVKFLSEPVEGGAYVIDFARAGVVLAVAPSGAAEIETQHREAELVERLHRVKDDFVVQGAAVERMGVANNRRVGRARRSCVEEGFEPSGGAGKEQRANGGGGVGHGLEYNGEDEGPLPATQSQRTLRAERPLLHPQGSGMLSRMDLFALTRRLVDVESITGNEAGVGEVLCRELAAHGFEVHKMPVEGDRFNVVVTSPGAARPEVVFSTHMDTVPPFIPSSENETRIFGRGSCDAKGIIAIQIAAAARLREEGIRVGLLFVVGEERDSQGAKTANDHAIGSRFLINGEPTENRLAVASKGTLRAELVASGRMAHSAYPELGESAIDKLIVALTRLRAMPLPQTPGIGPCTFNIGLIEGGRAPNVIPDHAKAHLLYRLVGPTKELRRRIVETVGELARVDFYLEIPFMRFREVDGLPTMVAAFTTDIPALGNWGEPLLTGPGSIHVAHTDGEYVEKQQLTEAVKLYCNITRKLSSVR